MTKKSLHQLLIVMLVVMSAMVMPISMSVAHAEGGRYDRYLAWDEATRYLDFPYLFPSDCTFYVSMALWAGGLPHSDEWTMDSPDRSKWASDVLAPGVTKTVAVADLLVKHLVREGYAQKIPITWSDNTAAGAQISDVIAYDWDGNGVIDHLAIVTGFTDTGYPTVSQHSPTQSNRYWSWSIGDNNWIEFAYPGSKAYLIHIIY